MSGVDPKKLAAVRAVTPAERRLAFQGDRVRHDAPAGAQGAPRRVEDRIIRYRATKKNGIGGRVIRQRFRCPTNDNF